MAQETFDKINAYRLQMNGPLTNTSDQQAAAIADVPAVSNPPTQAEVNAVVSALNAVLRALRSGTGVGIISQT